MRKSIIFFGMLLLLLQIVTALQVSTTPLDEGVLYVNSAKKFFYIYIDNDKADYDYVKIYMDPNSDYKFADSEFAFLYEVQLYPHQHVKIPIQINNVKEEFVLSYDLESEDFITYDSFLVLPEEKKAQANAAAYTAIITLIASAIMMILYIWNRFVYNSYKIDYYNRTKKHRTTNNHKDFSSAKL